jgi:ABC-2 type transport system ATP-binding protein
MITARGLTKYYGEKCAILDLDFDIQRGEIVGFLGLNGAGKTTALRILSCLLLPSTGRVTLGGLDVVDQPHEIRKQVGFLPEEPPLYREMTVESYLRFAGELRGLDRGEVGTRLEETLELTRTRDVRGELIGSLSYGYRKRVGIAQAIIHQPPVLILDEPISGLDPVQIVEMREMIRGLGGRHTVLVSSHILPEISQTCDRILVIQDGEIVAAGTEEELTSRLTGGHRLQLIVRGAADEVEKLVAGQEHVTGCTVSSTHDGVVVLRVTTAQDLRERLSRELVQAGFGLLQLGPAEAELESIFIQLTRKKKEVVQ